tara:strand:- start:617 stop:817 length:201 start_codon:yes stop_codon:yes gene_type:complete
MAPLGKKTHAARRGATGGAAEMARGPIASSNGNPTDNPKPRRNVLLAKGEYAITTAPLINGHESLA